MAQELNRGVGGSLPNSQAKEWIKNYKDKNPGEIQSHFFGSDIILTILSQADCVGVRIHYALDEKGVKQLILVGAKENGNNIWPSTTDSTPSGIMADNSWPCPPMCTGNDD
ncbi:MAG: hypothetical protein HOP08_09395 [Cyclobacteriaceae bacterium]|nr:hypothetical protein [Cyclobacteriaceae bacterium]